MAVFVWGKILRQKLAWPKMAKLDSTRMNNFISSSILIKQKPSLMLIIQMWGYNGKCAAWRNYRDIYHMYKYVNVFTNPKILLTF